MSELNTWCMRGLNVTESIVFASVTKNERSLWWVQGMARGLFVLASNKMSLGFLSGRSSGKSVGDSRLLFAHRRSNGDGRRRPDSGGLIRWRLPVLLPLTSPSRSLLTPQLETLAEAKPPQNKAELGPSVGVGV